MSASPHVLLITIDDLRPELAGTSHAGAMGDPSSIGKPAAFSRWHDWESVRTDRYRYSACFDDRGRRTARMLYDHETDPDETANVAEAPDRAEVVARHEAMLTAVPGSGGRTGR